MADRLTIVDRTRIRGATEVELPPIAIPAVLGLLSWAGATFLVSTALAGWYRVTGPGAIQIVPFAAVLGGLAQFLAAMWSYRTRNTLNTAMFGTWGCFWLAYGILSWVLALGVGGRPASGLAGSPELGYWFIVMAGITSMGTFAGFVESLGLGVWLACAAAASVLSAVGLLAGSGAVTLAGAWVFIVSSLIAWYTGSAMMLEATMGREVLPFGRRARLVEEPAVVTEEVRVPPTRRVG